MGVETRLSAGPDKEPGNIDWRLKNDGGDWEDCWAFFPYVDDSGYKIASNTDPKACLIKTYVADSEWIPAHCQTDQGHKLDHFHFQYDFGDTVIIEDTTRVATRKQVNDFWDWMFGRYTDGAYQQYNPLKITRLSNATNRHNCFSYALDAKKTGGASYEYWMQYEVVGTALQDDFAKRDNTHDVESGDLLYWNHYGYSKYLSIATNVMPASGSGNVPATIRWKWQASGVYQCATESGHRFHQPRNICGAPNVKSSSGVWSLDYCGGAADVWTSGDD
ncbi:MAG: hypothetical protein J7M19_02550 [Planctomycetes bacterium]|nr:hypothetical protein [Planctomycetota bacterium]